MTARDAKERSLRRRVGQLSTLQQRFEESRVGEVVISGLVVLIVVIGVAWNLPDSPIRRSLLPVLGPVATAAYLNQEWSMFAPTLSTRLETIEVHVTMSDGGDRVWTVQPGDRVIGRFAWNHWATLTRVAAVDPTVRADIARWAVREVTEPSERAIRVAMILRVENIPAPGQNVRGATAMKIVYQEDLTGQH